MFQDKSREPKKQENTTPQPNSIIYANGEVCPRIAEGVFRVPLSSDGKENKCGPVYLDLEAFDAPKSKLHVMVLLAYPLSTDELFAIISEKRMPTSASAKARFFASDSRVVASSKNAAS